jgi:hypothetical protein
LKTQRSPGKSRRLLSTRRTKRVRVLLFLLVVMLSFTGVVYGAVTIGGSSGPIWLNPGFRFTADVTAMSSPHTQVCLQYSVDGAGVPLIPCTCSSPGCNPTTDIGTWVCDIPINFSSATIDWDISAYYPGPSCPGFRAQGPTGSFNTRPTATGLTSLAAAASTDSARLLLLPGLAILASGLAMRVYLRRRPKSPS